LVNLRRSGVIATALLLLPLLSSCVDVLSPQGWAPVTFDGETAYVSAAKGRLSAIDIDGVSGTARWTFPDKDRDEDDDFDTGALYGAPIVEGDRLFFTSWKGGVYSLNKEDGRPIWPLQDPNTSRLDGNIPGGLAIAGANLYFGTTEGKLYGWKTSDGTTAAGWQEPKELDGGIWATPVATENTLWVATMRGSVYRFALDTGEQVGTPFKVTGAIPELALINEDLLFVPSINRTAYVLSTADGSQVAEFPADNWVWTMPGVSDTRVAFGDFSGHVYGLDITSAPVKQLWGPAEVGDGERVKAGAVIIDDVVVVVDRGPVVTFLNANDGSVLNTVPILDAGTVRTNLTAHDGAAYLVTSKGRLFRADPAQGRVQEVLLSGVKK